LSVKAIEALTRLVEEQGRQIVDLSKALAIAHEVHSGIAPVQQLPSAPADQRKLWMTEDEEDELYASGETPREDTRAALEAIIAEAGIPAPITFTQ
jgi:hypothetical protein